MKTTTRKFLAAIARRAINSGAAPMQPCLPTRAINSRSAPLPPRIRPRQLASSTDARSFQHRRELEPEPDSRYKGCTPLTWGIAMVPENKAFIVERFYKYSRTLNPGIHVLIPFIDRIVRVHCLEEQAIVIPHPAAMTKDNVTLEVEGVLYICVVDPKLATYGIQNYMCHVIEVARNKMRHEIGRMTLDEMLRERETLNENIMVAVNEATKVWGLKSRRYEIRDITLPVGVKAALEELATAEQKRQIQLSKYEGEAELWAARVKWIVNPIAKATEFLKEDWEASGKFGKNLWKLVIFGGGFALILLSGIWVCISVSVNYVQKLIFKWLKVDEPK